jgi:hypothetical protein
MAIPQTWYRRDHHRHIVIVGRDQEGTNLWEERPAPAPRTRFRYLLISLSILSATRRA